MDYLDFTVHCPKKAVKLNHSLTHPIETVAAFKEVVITIFIIIDLPPHTCFAMQFPAYLLMTMDPMNYMNL